MGYSNQRPGRFRRDDAGATAIEYALIAGATCLALITSLPGLQVGLDAMYAAIGGYF